MEPMTSPACEKVHGEIAMEALGALDAAERTALRAHLDGCAACRELADELAGTVGALALADPADVAPTAFVPPRLTAAVLGTLRTEARAARRRTVVTWGACAAVGVAAASLAIVAALAATPGAAGSRTVTLHGTVDAVASAVLTARPWGTSIAIDERGLPTGVFTVSMRTSSGTWWDTGTYRSVRGATVTATMACAVPLHEITGVRVTSPSGAVALASYSAPGTTW